MGSSSFVLYVSGLINKMRETTSNVKFADLVNKFPKTSLARQSKTVVRRETLTIPSNRNTPGRNSSNNPPEVAQPRPTWLRYSASNNKFAKNNRRESMAVPGGRVSGVKKSTSQIDRPAVVQYKANQRGILRCQAWPINDISIEPIAPIKMKNKKYKIQYPNKIKNKTQVYCPRCDLFFLNKDDYLNHQLIKQMKAPHAHTLYMNKIRDINSSLELKEEVRDIRNRAKVARAPRKTRRMTLGHHL